MAPRGRPTQRGHARMDAAFDALCPYGFPEKLVRRTVTELLNVYGGKDGWVFIEDGAYMLLIETILEKQNIASQSQDDLIQDNARDDHQTETLGCALPTNDAVNTASATTNESDNQLPIPLSGNFGSSENHGTNLIQSPPQTKPPQPVESLCHKRRRPCYGWICSDDEEDLKQLPPRPLPEELAMLIDGVIQ